ncbi:MAG: PucR family transcriptional regulator [Desulfovibrio sp.]|uniref:PucR family transcriptional regulator n=1 Tax=Desulfovibrio sp. 7SRBS1 TaxID=3378064 RepID=UPI003B3FD4E1
MLDQQLINEIKAALDSTAPVLFSICDTSGRVVASNDISEVGAMNLDAITAINEDRKVLPLSNSTAREYAVPLRHNRRFIGALVVRGSQAEMAIDLLRTVIELLYAEKLRTKDQLQQAQFREKFQQVWIQRQDGYDRDFIEQGKRLDIDITRNHQVLVIDEPGGANTHAHASQRLIDANDFLLTDVTRFTCVILRENNLLQQKIHRILALHRECKVAIGSLNNHLHTSYTEAVQSLKIGKSLFPGQQCYRYEQLELAICIADAGIKRQLGRTFAVLVNEGHTARLAQTAIAYMQHNGNIPEVCEALHIHRNSIQYRLGKIRELCGRDLKNSYDLLHVYASYISYLLEHGPID